jgi:hypothetical protein
MPKLRGRALLRGDLSLRGRGRPRLHDPDFGGTGAPARTRGKGRILEVRASLPVQVGLCGLLVCMRHAQNRALSEVLAKNLHADRQLCFGHADRN